MKQTQHKSIAAITIATLLLWVGCSEPVLHDRPSEKSCKEWLSDQKIVLEQGMILDKTWTIKPNEFRSFNMLRIEKNNDGTATMKVRFDLYDGQMGLRVDATLVYRFIKEEHATMFVSFTPTRLLKMGKW